MTSRAAAVPAQADGLPAPRRYWAIAAIWLAMTMAVIDGSIVNVALPTIARELHTTAAASIWILNAYQLAATVTLLPFAALGDKLGYRPVYVAGLVVYACGAVACVSSHTLQQLIAARVLEGLGAGAVMSLGSALVRFTFPHRQLGRAIGVNAMVISGSAAAGPSLAALILANGPWEWLFALGIPIGFSAALLGRFALPRTVGSGRRFDWLSALLNAVTFGFLILGAEGVAREGSWIGGVELAVGLVTGVFLVRRELRLPVPLVPFDLMRIPIFAMSIATSIVSFSAQTLAYVALPFYFQDALGRSPVETGLLMTPWPIGIGIGAPIAGRLADRYPAGALGAFGLATLAAGMVLVAFLPVDASTLDIAWRMGLCGVGFGFFQSPNNRAMVTSSPLNRSGAAGGMLATARLLGQTTGAVTMAVLFGVLGPSAARTGLLSAAVVAVVAACVSFSRVRVETAPKPETPEEAAEAVDGI